MNLKLCAVIFLAWVYICYGQGTPDTFLRLRDTPDSYVGQGLKFVRVNTAANALEFTSASGGGATVFTGLGDVPSSYAGSALKAVRVNAAANALEFYTPSVGPIATTDLTDFNAAHGSNGQIPIWDSATTTYIPGDPIVSGPDAVGVAPTKNPVQIGAKFLTTPSTLTNNQVGSLQLDATQNLLVKLQNTSVAVTGTFWQTTQPVSGTFWQTTQPVSIATMPSTPVTGTFWQATQPVSGTFWQATQPVSGTVTANQGGTWTVQPGNTANTTAWKVDGSAVTQPVSGTFWQATQPVSGTVTVTPPTLTKGTQGATGFSTQDLKDAGRSTITAYAQAVAGSASEAIISTFSLSRAFGAPTASVTSLPNTTVTAGKTFRIQKIIVSFVSTTTTANSSQIGIRVNTAGAASISSNLVMLFPRITWPTATFVANEGQTVNLDVPDGLEVPAAAGVGITHKEAAANGTIDVSVIGYEY